MRRIETIDGGLDVYKRQVVEDAFAGIDAAKAGGMKALGVGDASRYEKADITAPTLAEIAPEKLIE